ncbi:M28 family metallopeptidase [Solitalea lacus]|uniref:M28 family metallopeptidase n=1 Tax=Solitalea lacus TaxID=2911172 RepID=UPI001EDA0C15|nr:M28 family peptidase [Solitalea lacus]UKJ07611.1 M28 family peptidase [Solitalea lacus]
MKRNIFILLALLTANIAFAQKVDTAYKKITNSINIKEGEVHQIISTLAADSMLGRGLFNRGAEIAANFIEKEYKQIGLEPLKLPSIKGFRQGFSSVRVQSLKGTVKVGDSIIDNKKVIYVSDKADVHWQNTDPEKTKIEYLGAKDDILKRLKEIESSKKDAIILVDEQLGFFFNNYKARFRGDRFESDTAALAKASYVFILTNQKELPKYDISIKSNVNHVPLSNIIGMIPGTSKKDEYVIFSAHYDNVGTIAPNKGDSIANGADENASGVTAVLALAKYFKEKGDNERTLLFVNYGAETNNAASSKFFAKNIDANQVVAVINVDAIGKMSKFGPRSAFITGYDKSDLGSHLTEAANHIKFKFKADPYKDKTLFYQAGNTALGMMGVPAHTFSTIQIDIDRYFNSVRDDMNTIELENMVETIKAIAYTTDDLVKGKFTPVRISNYKDDPSSPKNLRRAQVNR